MYLWYFFACVYCLFFFKKHWPLKYLSFLNGCQSQIENQLYNFATTTFVLHTCSSNTHHQTPIVQCRQHLSVMIYKNDHYSWACVRALTGNIHLSAGCLKQSFSNLSLHPNHLGICYTFQSHLSSFRFKRSWMAPGIFNKYPGHPKACMGYHTLGLTYKRSVHPSPLPGF